jgi:bifunctional oligoribonuclease and PAP phosphatase NrnA
MSYQTPSDRLASVRQALQALERAERIILTTHVNSDGDGVGCQAALLSFLEERGIQAWVVNPTPIPQVFHFLLDDPARILDPASPEAQERCQAADLCVVVDTGEVSRIGRVKPLVDDLPKVVVDHHPPGDREIEGLSLRDPSAAAAGELVFDLILEAGGPWTRTVVDGLYVALLTDTGSFRFSNATPNAHRVVAELVARGASPDQLHRKVYGSFPLRAFRLRARALETLELSPGGKVAWMTVPLDAYLELECTPSDLEGMVDFPREVEGVEVGLLFRELEDGNTKISFRSNGPADVNTLARSFGGGGHARAAGALLSEPLEPARERVLAETLQRVEGEGRGTATPVKA